MGLTQATEWDRHQSERIGINAHGLWMGGGYGGIESTTKARPIPGKVVQVYNREAAARHTSCGLTVIEGSCRGHFSNQRNTKRLDGCLALLMMTVEASQSQAYMYSSM